MKKITIPNYIPTLTKGVYQDLEIFYQLEDNNEVIVDEVFCNGANLTELMSMATKHELSKEVERMLQRESDEAKIALQGW
jgi:hypothetical protein